MSYITNKDILGDKMSLESKIKWFERSYVFMGISKEIKEFEENTEKLSIEKRKIALDVLEGMVKYYRENYIVSGKYLEDDLNELKVRLGG